MALAACKGIGKSHDEPAAVTSSTATASASAVSTATASATSEPTASAAPSASAVAVKLEDCGQRYAAPARLDGKCADYCGGDYKCSADEKCTPTSWPTKQGVRNTQVCVGRGFKVREPVAGAAWDSNGPAKSLAATPSSGRTNQADGEIDPDKGKCPAGWTMAEEACHKPCTKDSDCHPPKSFCKKWEGKKLCAFTGSLVVPND